MWNFVTFFGDSSFTLPAALLLVVWLCYNTSWRMAFIWASCYCLTMLAVVLSKLLFMGWQIAPPGLNFTGMSGHSASAMALLPVAALLLTPAQGKLRTCSVSAAILLALAVGYSRLPLGAHSPSEIVTGLTIGLTGAGLFIIWLRHRPPAAPLRRRGLAALLLLGLFFATDFKPAPTQDLLGQVAQALSGRAQPYTRLAPL